MSSTGFTPPENPLIYRFLHIDNLSWILEREGLDAPSTKLAEAPPYKTIHHEHIQTRRGVRRVSCTPGGTIHDYVPFYFAPCSPMLYAIKMGNVAGYVEGQAPLVYVVSSIQKVTEAGLRFAFTDGQAAMAFSSFSNDLSELHKVDWPLMKQQYWKDTAEDNDRKRRRQAEFLIHRFFPWNLVSEIGVMSTQMQSRVSELLGNGRGQPLVNVRRTWYF